MLLTSYFLLQQGYCRTMSESSKCNALQRKRKGDCVPSSNARPLSPKSERFLSRSSATRMDTLQRPLILLASSTCRTLALQIDEQSPGMRLTRPYYPQRLCHAIVLVDFRAVRAVGAERSDKILQYLPLTGEQICIHPSQRIKKGDWLGPCGDEPTK